MKTLSQICNGTTADQTWEAVNWGHTCLVDDEITALRIAYAQRNTKYGVEAKHLAHIGKYQKTIFNEKAAKLGLNK